MGLPSMELACWLCEGRGDRGLAGAADPLSVANILHSREGRYASCLDVRILRIPAYHIDAFAGEVFSGNPAMVCPLDRWLDDESLRLIAREHHLPPRSPAPRASR